MCHSPQTSETGGGLKIPCGSEIDIKNSLEMHKITQQLWIKWVILIYWEVAIAMLIHNPQ